MTTNIKSAGADLDSLFAVRTSTKIADVGYQVSGTDISNRFEPRGATTARANTNIKSGGTDLAQLFKDLGAAAVVSLSDQDLSTLVVAPASSTCGYRLDSTGDIQKDSNGSFTDIGDWISPKSAAPGTYEAMVTVTSGTLSSGTTGTWLALTSNREWSISSNLAPGKVCTFTIQIRQGTTVLATATITLTVNVL